jgi:hypothetical protein
LVERYFLMSSYLVYLKSRSRLTKSLLALWELPWFSHKWRWLSEEPVAFEIEVDALKQMLDIKNAIATAFEHFDFVVVTFSESAGIAIEEEVRNFIQPV